MALSFIGKPISLISHSDVRYRGILAGIDPAASTIQLSNVYSMGTESRRPPAEFIPPVQEPYQYIIFRASEVKDLAVDEPAPRRSVHDDPAVLGASAPTAPAVQYGQYGAPAPAYPPSVPQPQIQPQPSQQQPQQQLQQQPMPQAQQPTARTAGQQDHPAPSAPNRSSGQAQGGRRNNSVYTAAASLETVERALGDLRVANGNTAGGGAGGGGGGGSHRHGRRGHGQQGGGGGGTALAQGLSDIKAGEIKVPATDFDFQSSNALFDKAALAQRKVKDSGESAEDPTGDAGDGEEGKVSREKDEEKEPVAYNPQKSFFDSLSSSTQGPESRAGGDLGGSGAGRGGGRRGGGAGKNRREEERERNVATFGEPGGVGLMGPGAYVSGWGGYGRRGGRSRRGGAVVAARERT